jgi:hypothetical protein
MTHSRLLTLLSVSTALAFTACAAEEGPNDTTASDDGTAVHMLRMHNSSDGAVSNVAPRIAGLTYFGGPLLKNVEVRPVFWNSATKLQANANSFYAAVVRSPLYTMLAQYNIGLGTAVAGFVDNRTATSVSDAAIHTELNRLFTAGSLPLPNANRYYPVHFPSGTVITAPDGSRSCVVFCAYHGTYVRNGVNVNYGVIPDIGSGGCQNGCGGSTVTNNTDSVASHELVEATTDPAVGLATVFGPPLGWYDQPDNQEIGDLCNAQQGSSAGFTVQKEWSNRNGACVDH